MPIVWYGYEGKRALCIRQKALSCANEPYLTAKKCYIIRSIDACVCDMTHLCVWNDSLCVTWLIHMCDVTRSYECETARSCVWCDSFVCVAWLIRICGMTNPDVWHDSFVRVTRPFFFGCVWYEWQDVCSCVCDVTRSYVWHIQDEWIMSHTLCIHDGVTHSVYAWHCSLICDVWHRWHDPLCDMTLSYMTHVWPDSLIHEACVTRLTHIWYMLCDMTHWSVWHDSLICDLCDMTHWSVKCVWHDSLLCHTSAKIWCCAWRDSIACVAYAFIRVIWLTYGRDMTPLHVWHDSFFLRVLWV